MQTYAVEWSHRRKVLLDQPFCNTLSNPLQVLKFIPWDKIKVRLLCIEINHIRGRDATVRSLLETKGYLYLGTGGIDAWFGLRSLLEETMNVDEFLSKVSEERENSNDTRKHKTSFCTNV